MSYSNVMIPLIMPINCRSALFSDLAPTRTNNAGKVDAFELIHIGPFISTAKISRKNGTHATSS
jgi:hypothetical protein